MKTLVDFDVTVDTAELRGSLIAVLPHASKNPDLAELNRLRVFVSPDGLQLAATDRYTLAVSQVAVRESSSVVGCFDVSPDQAKKLLAIFRPGRGDDASLRLEVTEKHLRATDVSGMFPGESLSLTPLAVDEGFPDVADLLASLWRNRSSIGTVEFALSGEHVARFRAASRSLSATLLFELSRGAVVVSGHRFAAAVMCCGRDDEVREDDEAARVAWLSRLGAMSECSPAPPPGTPASETDSPDGADDANTAVDLAAIRAARAASDDEGGGDE